MLGLINSMAKRKNFVTKQYLRDEIMILECEISNLRLLLKRAEGRITQEDYGMIVINEDGTRDILGYDTIKEKASKCGI